MSLIELAERAHEFGMVQLETAMKRPSKDANPVVFQKVMHHAERSLNRAHQWFVIAEYLRARAQQEQTI